LFNDENKSYVEYLYKRGLNDEVIKHFQIGYAPRESDLIYKMATNHNNMFGSDYNKE
jgi:DNA primase